MSARLPSSPATRPLVRAGVLALAALVSAAVARRDSQPTTRAPEVQALASGLEAVWSLAFAPDGRLFVAERPGRIRVIQHDSLRTVPWAVVPAYRSEEAGLMGLAVDPDFARNGRVYLCYTALRPDNGVSNRIAVLTEKNGEGTGLEVLLDGMPAGPFHNAACMSRGSCVPGIDVSSSRLRRVPDSVPVHAGSESSDGRGARNCSRYRALTARAIATTPAPMTQAPTARAA